MKTRKQPATFRPGTGSPLRAGAPPVLRNQLRVSCAIFSNVAWLEIARSLRLTRRELQIVRGIFDDRIEFAIAADLGISSHTVHTHLERLRHKLGVVDRVGIVLQVMNEFLMLTALPGNVLPPLCGKRAAGRCPLRR